MNKLALITATTLALSGLANAQTGTDPKTASEIANQISVTQNTTALLLQKINTQSISPNVNVSDYKKFKREFHEKVEATLSRYENNLRNDAFKRVSILMDRYNAIYHSKEYTSEQKKSILPEQLALIKNQMTEISKLYQKYLFEVLGAAGKIPYQYNWHWLKSQFFRDNRVVGNWNSELLNKGKFRCNFTPLYGVYQSESYVLALEEYSRNYLDGSSLTEKQCTAKQDGRRGAAIYAYDEGQEILIQKPFQTDDVNAFQIDTYPYLRSFCQSQLCVSFVAADISLFLSLVSSDIDKDLSFKLADGNEIKLSAMALLRDNKTPFEQLRLAAYPMQDFESLPYDTAQ